MRATAVGNEVKTGMGRRPDSVESCRPFIVRMVAFTVSDMGSHWRKLAFQ